MIYSFFKNSGKFKITLFKKIKLSKVKFFLKGKQLYVRTTKKQKQISLNLNDENFIFYNELQKSVLKKILLKKFQIDIFVGVKDNPFLTSMLSGQLQVLLGMLFGYLHTKNQEGRTVTSVHTDFNKEQLLVMFEGKIYVSVITIFLSIIEAYYKKIKNQGAQKQYGK